MKPRKSSSIGSYFFHKGYKCETTWDEQAETYAATCEAFPSIFTVSEDEDKAIAQFEKLLDKTIEGSHGSTRYSK